MGTRERIGQAVVYRSEQLVEAERVAAALRAAGLPCTRTSRASKVLLWPCWQVMVPIDLVERAERVVDGLSVSPPLACVLAFESRAPARVPRLAAGLGLLLLLAVLFASAFADIVP